MKIYNHFVVTPFVLQTIQLLGEGALAQSARAQKNRLFRIKTDSISIEKP